MDRLIKIKLVAGLVLILSGIFSLPVFAAPVFNIAVIQDCKAGSRPGLLEDVKTEILSLTRGEFDVRFPPAVNIFSDCSDVGIKSDLKRLLSDSRVDMIISLGPLSSGLLGQFKDYPKPCIAGIVLNPKLQSIPFSDNRSGVKNFTYVSLSSNLKGNVKQFKEVVPFKTAAFLYDESMSVSAARDRLFLSQLEKDTETRVLMVPVGRNADSAKAQLVAPVDAVFLGYLVQLGEMGVSDLIDHLNQKKIPSFTFHDRVLVEKGLLAGFDRTADLERLSKRIAILVQRVLLKEDPRDFKVSLSGEEVFVINMETARALEISPSFALMAKAELLKSEMFLSMDATPAVPSDEKKQKSSILSGDTSKLDAESFNLKEEKTSLSLLDAVDWALENNLLLKSRAKETEAGKMNVKQALSKFFPQLGTSLNWTAIDQEHTSAISGVAERSWEISARVGQLLYSDQVYTDLKTSRRLQNIQELSEHQEKLDIILETGIAYLSVLKARAGAKIQLDNLNLVRSNLILANNRYKAGFSGPSDVYRLESEAAIAHSNFLSYLADVGKARIHLNQILNLNQEESTTIKDIRQDDGLFIISDPKLKAALKIDNPGDFRRFRDFMVKKGLDASPEIKALNEQILIQEDAYNLAKRSYWSPNVSVSGSIGNTFSKSGEGSDLNTAAIPGSLSTIFQEPDDTRWNVSLNIDLPFYQGGYKSAAKIKALETKSQISFFKNDIQNQISENIRTALFDLSASYPAIELTALSAKAAQKNLELVQDAYSKGAVSIVNFLDAQNAALVANTFAENAVYDFFIDYMIAERATGQFTLFMDEKERKSWIQDFQK